MLKTTRRFFRMLALRYLPAVEVAGRFAGRDFEHLRRRRHARRATTRMDRIIAPTDGVGKTSVTIALTGA